MEGKFSFTSYEDKKVYDEIFEEIKKIPKHLSSLSYTQGIYHYTLYYYDRAGNLVRTVAPAGVVTTSTNRNTHPAHTFVMKYKYNSLKQTVEQFTPDGDTIKFWHDYKGQLRFSQNIKQKMAGKYSYMKYDNLGRIIEGGESSLDGSSTFYTNVNTSTYPGSSNSQRSYTIYSTAASGIVFRTGSVQRYLLNRISYTYTDDNIYTYYSYDPHGNVEWLIQDIPGLGKNYIRYEYDLISNKVLAVHYNEGTVDEFHHKYTYDEDQRIKTASTAWGSGKLLVSTEPAIIETNNIGWDRDATYKYYLHGPLKRLEIGEDHIQGIDYVYTINGWLKGINHPTLKPSDDPGGDNNTTFCADAFGMVLGYHANDFNRTSSKYNPSTTSLVSSVSSGAGTAGVELFNGNASSWTMQTDTAGGGQAGQLGFKYRYDQLNRLKIEDYRSFNGSAWSNTASYYDNNFTYDGNGRITKLNRYGNGSRQDSMVFNYYASKNQLEYVTDQVVDGTYATDADGQAAGNYTYDAIGQRTMDTKNGIDNIEWTVYGKVKSIKQTDGDSLKFLYDALGNRVQKYFRTNAGVITITYYAVDANGNDLAIYERTTSGSNYIYKLKEANIFGADLIGTYKPDVTLRTVPTSGASSCFSCATTCVTIDITRSAGLFTRNIDKKEYALKDYNKAVKLTVGDRKTSNNWADIKSYNTLFSYGSPLPGTSMNYNGNSFRYGYGMYEKDDEVFNQTGASFDMGARLYDARIPVVPAPEPKYRKYPQFSPYVAMGGNPILFADLDGKDIIILSAPGAVGGLGHAAVLIGNDKEGWTLYSKNGTYGSSSNSRSSGPANKDPQNGKKVGSLANFATEYNLKANGDVEYTSAFRITTSAETDAKMKEAASEQVASWYDVTGIATGSCIDVCSDALEAGKLDPGLDWDGGRSPVPNTRFKDITENNKGTFVTDKIMPDKATVDKKKEEYKKSTDAETKAAKERLSKDVNKPGDVAPKDNTVVTPR